MRESDVSEITDKTVEKIARLANLQLAQDESGRFAGQLEKILGFIHTLNQLDTTGVAETAHAQPLQNVWREDVVVSGLEREAAIAEAPDGQEQGFRVPRIIE
jgi:aspartyl-tRNA(Asn)/glutamyl-tRNA(Gln) amidotransferase subunit C